MALPPTQQSSPTPSGTLALIGGRFERDNDALFAALRQRCNGRIAILSMASGYPEEVGQETVEDFRDQGFYAELIPIFFENRTLSAWDPSCVERLRAFGSVFFTGGDQSRIVGTLVQNEQETPALTAIRSLYQSGGLIAGSSAGAAIMSGPMILGGTSLNALVYGAESGASDVDDFDVFRMGSGLGFFRWGMVDQHFLARGRIGRLVRAAQLTNQSLAFGIDENTGLLVQANRGVVVGETGVMMLDLRESYVESHDGDIRNIDISYLDDGDAVDLLRGKPLPASDKKRARVSKTSYRTPAPVRRNAFAGYGIHDLMLRLVECDPAQYASDYASAYDEATETQVTLRLTRRRRKSRALRAIRRSEIRYSALHFVLDIEQQPAVPALNLANNQLLRPSPTPDAKLIMLGSAPQRWGTSEKSQLLQQLQQPVAILPTASGEPRMMAERYATWLDGQGIRHEIFPITLSNIERASRDRALMRQLDGMGSLLLTGGDQRRLTESLLHCAEATPVLHHIVTAYELGKPIMAVAAAASALGEYMIAEGDSESALRYGSSEDASGSGVIVEPGIGITSIGLIDQHFIERNRLGRLLVACASHNHRFGFGLGEHSGLVVYGDGDEVEAIGEPGVFVVERTNSTRLGAADPLNPSDLRIYLLPPGKRTALDALHRHALRSGSALECLATELAGLEHHYRRAVPDRAFVSSDWEKAAGL